MKGPLRAISYWGPSLGPVHKKWTSTNESAWIANFWAQGVYIGFRPMRPKANVAGDMAAFGGKFMVLRQFHGSRVYADPIHTAIQSGLHPTPVVRSFKAESHLWCGVDKLG